MTAAQHARAVEEAAAVHIGTTYAGELVLIRCGLVLAYSATGRSLGSFADPRAAALAVLLASRQIGAK